MRNLITQQDFPPVQRLLYESGSRAPLGYLGGESLGGRSEQGILEGKVFAFRLLSSCFPGWQWEMGIYFYILMKTLRAQFFLALDQYELLHNH